MKREIIIAFMFVLMPLILVIGQEAKVEIELETEHILFGQTTYARYAIFNISESPIYIGGYQHKSGNFQLMGYEAKAIYPDGKEVPQHKDAEMIIGKKATPKKVLKRGECLTFSQPVPITDVTIEELPFGQYKLIFILRYSLKEEEGLFEAEGKPPTDCLIGYLPFSLMKVLGKFILLKNLGLY